jgi:hypothetical protein
MRQIIALVLLALIAAPMIAFFFQPAGTLRNALALATLAEMALLGTTFMPRYWRHPAIPVRPEWGGLFLGDAIWRGFVRSLMAGVIGGWFLILAGVGILLADRKVIDETVPVWLGLGFFLFGFLGFSIVFFNRPKFLVPPSLRDQPGAVREWIGRHGS